MIPRRSLLKSVGAVEDLVKYQVFAETASRNAQEAWAVTQEQDPLVIGI